MPMNDASSGRLEALNFIGNGTKDPRTADREPDPWTRENDSSDPSFQALGAIRHINFLQCMYDRQE